MWEGSPKVECDMHHNHNYETSTTYKTSETSQILRTKITNAAGYAPFWRLPTESSSLTICDRPKRMMWACDPRPSAASSSSITSNSSFQEGESEKKLKTKAEIMRYEVHFQAWFRRKVQKKLKADHGLPTTYGVCLFFHKIFLVNQTTKYSIGDRFLWLHSIHSNSLIDWWNRER